MASVEHSTPSQPVNGQIALKRKKLINLGWVVGVILDSFNGNDVQFNLTIYAAKLTKVTSDLKYDCKRCCYRKEIDEKGQTLSE